MQKQFEAPELELIGDAEDVVMGTVGCDTEMGYLFTPDFEFEQD
jgi:hypothetical protein